MSIPIEKDTLKLRRSLLTMSAFAESRVAQAFEALFGRDVEMARTVRNGDDEIDRMEIDIESECLRTLALDAPVAGDLRFILAAMRINSSLERIADMARLIAKKVIKLERFPPLAYPPSLTEMADEVGQMFADACRALAENDAELAAQVRRRDDHVDAKTKEFTGWVLSIIRDDRQDAEAAIAILLVGRTIERIGDFAVAIAEDVIFSVGGSIVRHTPA